MFTRRFWIAVTLSGLLSAADSPRRAADPATPEWQLTYSPISHLLDNNDNFSRDDRFLVVDTRDTLGGGIGNGTTIMKISTTTGLENTIYAPYPIVVNGPTGSAPGLGAASYNPAADEVVFIHGPLMADVPTLGWYGTTNRRGGVVIADGNGELKGFLDYRDVTSAVTTPGAHRGGTHRHEYARASTRIGFTYDDMLMTTYARTIGMLVPHERAPKGVTHWAVLLLDMAPTNGAQPGQVERAADDSWVGAKAVMRGFIGRVKEADGTYKNSLFVVDIPENVDVTTAVAGTTTTYPKPPQGVRMRRLTNVESAGIIRGSLDGTRIAYYATAPDNTRQVRTRRRSPKARACACAARRAAASSGWRWCTRASRR